MEAILKPCEYERIEFCFIKGITVLTTSVWFLYSKAIHYGQTLHFAPIEGIYLISRKKDDETVIYIVNKNKSSKELNLDRYNQLGVNNMIFTEVYTKEKYKWTNSITLKKNSSIILTNR